MWEEVGRAPLGTDPEPHSCPGRWIRADQQLVTQCREAGRYPRPCGGRDRGPAAGAWGGEAAILPAPAEVQLVRGIQWGLFLLLGAVPQHASQLTTRTLPRVPASLGGSLEQVEGKWAAWAFDHKL